MAAILMATNAFAGTLPGGGAVVAGTAGIVTAGNTTTITQSSQNAIINWASFSVGQGNSVVFKDPNAQSATLNRVTGSATSTIAGQIISNGAVYLVNPNGIAITSTGAVQTGGGFVASTLGIADADFMAGRLNFAGTGASKTVTNAGKIIAGQGAYVALLGGAVSNAGTITVPLGRVGLGSGEQVALDLNGSGFMQVAVPTALVTGSRALVDNSGAIVVNGGRVTLSAAAVKGAVRNIIAMSGSINADSAVGDGGTITLIGGADTASMAGQVTVSGKLSANATGASGNGGFIETSGEHVNLSGSTVAAKAAHGKTGTWLIDPVDFTVAASGGDETGAALTTALASTNVTIKSSSGATGKNGDININDAVSWSANTLTLDAARNINVNAVMNATGTAGFAGIVGDTAQTGTGSTKGALLMGLSNGFYGTLNLDPTTSFSLNGTAYQIITALGAQGSTTGTDLQGINGALSGNYVLGTNIDASATSTWNGGAGFVALGTDGQGNYLTSANGNGFAGTFNGLGHTISGLFVNRASTCCGGRLGYSTGLFGYTGYKSSISNVGMDGGTFSGGDFAGALAGSNGGTITNAYSTAAVTGGGNSIGGLVGYDTGTITNAYATGAVSGADYVGGLVGYATGAITSSYATGAVTASGSYVGGLAGDAIVITNAYATGAVTGGTFVGGLAGGATTIRNAYAIGAVSGTLDAGGLLGRAVSSQGITNGYWDRTTTGQSVGVGYGSKLGAIGLTDAQMLDLGNFTTNYAGFDFQNVWSPPNQVGQNGNSSTANYPQLYALSNVIWVNGANASAVYGTTSPTDTVVSINGLHSGDTVTSQPVLSVAGSGLLNVGTYGVTSSGLTYTSADPDGYRVVTSGSIAITPAPLTLTYTANTATSLYGSAGATHPTVSGSVSGSGFVAGQTLADLAGTAKWVTPVSGTSNVGGYAITGSGLSATNYTITATQAAGNATAYSITPRPITVTAGKQTSVYGAATPALTYVVGGTGLVNGNTLTGALSTTASATANVGTYAITQGSLSGGGNYAITYVGANLTITPAPLTLTYTSDATTALYGSYGAAHHTITGTVSGSGFVNGQTLSALTGAATWTSAVSGTSNVGSYAVTGSGLSSTNYAITTKQAAANATAFQITARPITVTANKQSKVYGSTNPALTYVVGGNGLVNGNTMTGALATTNSTGSSVGTYAITQGSLTAGGNYIITYVGANLTVTPAPLTLTYTSDATTALYGSYGSAHHTITGTVTGTGFVNGQTLAALTGTASWTSAVSATSNVGSYAVTGSGLSSANYAITVKQAAANATAFKITARPITITANKQTSTQGSAIPALTYVVGGNGLVNGDTLNGGLATIATASSSAGTYAITQGSLAASSNYAVTYVGANLTITAKP